MDFPLKYKSNSGEEFDFMSDTAFWSECELRSYEWQFDLSDGQVKRFYREGYQVTIPVFITGAGTLLERDRLVDIFEKDVRSLTAGNLFAGDWSINCFCVKVSPITTWSNRNQMQFELTFVFISQDWYRETVHHFYPWENQNSSYWLDFPFDFPFDFMGNGASRSFVNNNIYPSEFKMLIFGRVQDPAIRVGGNLYNVETLVSEGERLEIDSREKTIKLIDQSGNVFNVFGARNKGLRGSGEYIFEQIKPGYNSVTLPTNIGFDLYLYEQRSVPPWVVS